MIRIGIVGLGRAATALLPSMLAHPEVEVVALAESRVELREVFCRDFPVRGYAELAELCADPEVDVVYVATPHQFHRDHVLVATAAGKHVLVEKPMALSLEECDEMIAAARRAGVVLLVGHTNGYDPPVLAIRELVSSGRFGELRMLNTFHYTDFLYRPRRPEELDTKLGGGIMFNQFPHQVDVARTIVESPTYSVSAVCGAWDISRATEASVAALVRFENDVVASIVYSGYGHLSSSAFFEGLDRAREFKGASKSTLGALSPKEETEAKARSGYLARRNELIAPLQPATEHERFGVLVAGFDEADIVTSPQGLTIYADGAVERLAVPFGSGGGRRAGVFDELAAAVKDGDALHDGEWGRETLATCLAALKSSEQRREVLLTE